jgi:pyridoxal phosphate enzyme (YggS family)
MTISDNIRLIREKIDEAARETGRTGADITLVAAAKMNPADRVAEAIRAGVDAVGENRVQEMLEKHLSGAYTGKPLHFIGHLQSNKVRQVVGLCDLIESVDSENLIGLIGKRAAELGITQDVLLEVNIGREENKSGVPAEELGRLLDFAAGTQGVRVRGLMAIPPICGNPNEISQYFSEMYKLFVDIRVKKYDNISNIALDFLSMGMSDSYVEAIRSGANMVRIGSAIFGHRQY